MLPELITYRTQADVERVKRLSGIGWDNLTADEKAEWLAGMIGAYNASDLNRVSAAAQYLSDALHAHGYTAKVSIKTDWQADDVPDSAQFEIYLNNIHNVKNAFYGVTPLPDSVDGLNYEEANNIERFFEEVDLYIGWMINGFTRRSGTFASGQGVILPT